MRIILSSYFTHEEIFSTKGYLLLQHIENTKMMIFKKNADLTYSD